MKKVELLITSFIFFFSIGFCQTADYPKTLPPCDTLSGYISKVDDILTGKVSPMRVITISTLSSILEIEYSGKININKLEQPMWGFVTWGTYYRFVSQFPGKELDEDQTKKKKVYMPVCKHGAICLY